MDIRATAREQIEKIVSGGQTGVDRAALDVAQARDIPVGGWCPKGRRAEDGPISTSYPLRETPAEEYAQRTAWNVRDSDGTLILVAGRPSGGTTLTVEEAVRRGKPFLVRNVTLEPEPDAVLEWLVQYDIRVLNVAGPRASESEDIYERAYVFLQRLLGAPS